LLIIFTHLIIFCRKIIRLSGFGLFRQSQYFLPPRRLLVFLEFFVLPEFLLQHDLKLIDVPANIVLNRRDACLHYEVKLGFHEFSRAIIPVDHPEFLQERRSTLSLSGFLVLDEVVDGAEDYLGTQR